MSEISETTASWFCMSFFLPRWCGRFVRQGPTAALVCCPRSVGGTQAGGGARRGTAGRRRDRRTGAENPGVR
ncbi:hypothetical protein GCM10023082_36790 [Streptomyces tremellae]|uniref:Uncharacterized protein n=1 Tax=Streptomyces tremellae TaxID=1124239 RepID=A0ABP7FDD0_9ACTN